MVFKLEGLLCGWCVRFFDSAGTCFMVFVMLVFLFHVVYLADK